MKIKFHITSYPRLPITSYSTFAQEVKNWIKQSDAITIPGLLKSSFYSTCLNLFIYPHLCINSSLWIKKETNTKIAILENLNFQIHQGSSIKNNVFKMFRSIFDLSNFDPKLNTSYIVSARKQIFMINRAIPLKVNF